MALGAPTFKQIKIPFTGVGSNEGQTLGNFTTEVTIDGQVFECEIHIVPDHYFSYKLLLGGEFLNVDIHVTKRQATVVKIKDDSTENENRFEYNLARDSKHKYRSRRR